MLVEYIIHSGMRNYTKLACNSLKIIPNDTVSQPIRQGMIGLGRIASTAAPSSTSATGYALTL